MNLILLLKRNLLQNRFCSFCLAINSCSLQKLNDDKEVTVNNSDGVDDGEVVFDEDGTDNDEVVKPPGLIEHPPRMSESPP